MEIEQGQDDQVRFCPIELAYNNSSIILGGRGRTDNPDALICPADCPGEQEVQRAKFSPLRVMFGSTRFICSRTAVDG